MPEAYPLESLLTVRRFREEAARRKVNSARLAAIEARNEIERCKKALEDWRVWREAEVERRYEAIIGASLPVSKLNDFNRALAKLGQDELEQVMKVDAAEREAQKAEAAFEKAKRAAVAAGQGTAKIEKHRELWREDMKKEAEHAEEREFEDFKPVSRLGASGDDE